MKLQVNNNELYVDDEFTLLSPEFVDNAVITIDSDIFDKIVEFGNYYLSLSTEDQALFLTPSKLTDSMKQWADSYFADSSIQTLDLLDCADKLNIRPLAEICAYTIAMEIKGMSASEIMGLFGLDKSTS